MRDCTVSAASGEWTDYEADAGEIERIKDGGTSMISQAILQWKKNIGIAVFSLCVAVFFIVAFIVLFIR